MNGLQSRSAAARAATAATAAAAAMPAPASRATSSLAPETVRVGCVMDAAPHFQRDALIFVRSLRWFGGLLAQSDVLVCAIGPVPLEVRRRFDEVQAEVREVQPFPARNGSAQRLRWFEEAARDPHAFYLHVDCDVFVGRDPLPLLAADTLQAKPAPVATVTQHVFERLFAHYGMPLPPATARSGPRITEFVSIPYFNAGVVAGPAASFARLVPVWARFNRELAERPELVAPCAKHLHQAALSLALVAGGLTMAEAPVELNYQLNLPHLTPSRELLAIDPALLHHHGRFDEHGFLQHPSAPLAQWRVERLNERLRGKTFAPAVPATAAVSDTPRVFVLGMHRAGTSALTRSLNLLGLWVGPDDRLPAADTANPLGYWENTDAVLLDEALLAAGGARWADPHPFDVADIASDARERFAETAAELVREFDRHGPWALKDPRLCLTLPLWRALGGDPIAVLVHRNPLAIARSLEQRDAMEPLHALALWEAYTVAAIRNSRGLRRTVVCYDRLIAEPAGTLERLRGELGGFGIAGLAETRAAFDALEPALDRSSATATADDLMNEAQRELARRLTAAAAGDREALEPVPALSAAAREILANGRRRRDRETELRRRVDSRDALAASLEAERLFLEGVAAEARRSEATVTRRLAAAEADVENRETLLRSVFASRTWRVGRRVSAWLQFLSSWRSRGAPPPDAEDRWLAIENRER